MIATKIGTQNTVPKKNVVAVMAYVKPEIRQELERMAAEDHRTLSSLAAKILTVYVEGELKKRNAES